MLFIYRHNRIWRHKLQRELKLDRVHLNDFVVRIFGFK